MNKKVKIGDLDFELPFHVRGFGSILTVDNRFVCDCHRDSLDYTFSQLKAETIADALNNHFAQGDLFHPQLETVIHFAFRYAIDRKTGAVSHMAKYLAQNWHRFAPHTQKQIHDEIECKRRMSGDEWKANELPFWAKILDLEISK